MQERATVTTGMPELAYSLHGQLPDLFEAIARQRNAETAPDGKILTDLEPQHELPDIIERHKLAIAQPDYHPERFVLEHFRRPTYAELAEAATTEASASLSAYITDMWPKLTRFTPNNMGSLLGQKEEYFVPGERFNEGYYWDTDDGLRGYIVEAAADPAKWQRVWGIVRNFARQIDTYGFVPTANRDYYLSRSQPPKFASMVKQLGEHFPEAIEEFLPQVVKEYNWWMKGAEALDPSKGVAACDRVVQLPGGVLLNRYWDNLNTPRPESFQEDIHTASLLPGTDHTVVFRHLRAGAESGRDFTARWFADPERLETIHTADFVPIDLNCMLWEYEDLIAQAHTRAGRSKLAAEFGEKAEQRAQAINTYLWNEAAGIYCDFDFVAGEQSTFASMAMAYPLYYGLASPKQAQRVAETLGRDFLQPGGFVSTLTETGQQWDAPNGWAPEQYVGVMGLRNYGYRALAEAAKLRWVNRNLQVFKLTGMLVEKVDAMSRTNPLGGGGEYKLQRGFLWTNGILRKFLSEAIQCDTSKILMGR